MASGRVSGSKGTSGSRISSGGTGGDEDRGTNGVETGGEAVGGEAPRLDDRRNKTDETRLQSGDDTSHEVRKSVFLLVQN